MRRGELPKFSLHPHKLRVRIQHVVRIATVSLLKVLNARLSLRGEAQRRNCSATVVAAGIPKPDSNAILVATSIAKFVAGCADLGGFKGVRHICRPRCRSQIFLDSAGVVVVVLA